MDVKYSDKPRIGISNGYNNSSKEICWLFNQNESNCSLKCKKKHICKWCFNNNHNRVNCKLIYHHFINLFNQHHSNLNTNSNNIVISKHSNLQKLLPIKQNNFKENEVIDYMISNG